MALGNWTEPLSPAASVSVQPPLHRRVYVTFLYLQRVAHARRGALLLRHHCFCLLLDLGPVKESKGRKIESARGASRAGEEEEEGKRCRGRQDKLAARRCTREFAPPDTDSCVDEPVAHLHDIQPSRVRQRLRQV